MRSLFALLRLSRICFHVLRGLITEIAIFPNVSAARRERIIQRWSEKLLAIMGVRIQADSMLAVPRGAMIVANHISWLDIFVLLALTPARFVAKADISGWPMVGRLAADAGTIFIERTRKSDTQRVNKLLEGLLREGNIIVVFPEGGTTDGTTVAPFHASLLAPAVMIGAAVHPVAIRYLHADGSRDDAPAFTDEQSLLRSAWRVASQRVTRVYVNTVAPIDTTGKDRRTVARLAHEEIFAVFTSDRAPEIPADLPAAPLKAPAPTRSRYPAQ